MFLRENRYRTIKIVYFLEQKGHKMPLQTLPLPLLQADSQRFARARARPHPHALKRDFRPPELIADLQGSRAHV